MPEAFDDHIEDQTDVVNNLFQGRTPQPLDEIQWGLQFGKDTPYDPNKKFYITQGQGTLDCALYDGVTGESLGWLRRY